MYWTHCASTNNLLTHDCSHRNQASTALSNLKGLTTSSHCYKTLCRNLKQILHHMTAQEWMSVTPNSWQMCFSSSGFTFCYSNGILWSGIFGKWYLGSTVESPCMIQIAAVKQHLVWQRFSTEIHKVGAWELNTSCAVISGSEVWSFLPLQIHLLHHLPLPKMQSFGSPLAARRTGIFASSQEM